jgi:hypothetical protein
LSVCANRSKRPTASGPGAPFSSSSTPRDSPSTSSAASIRKYRYGSFAIQRQAPAVGWMSRVRSLDSSVSWDAVW